MADWYVSPTGNDSTGDGSAGNPYQHIYKAWDVLTSGDTVYLADGTYDDEDTFVAISSKSFDIRSVSEDYSKVIIIPKLLVNTGVPNVSSWCYSANSSIIRNIYNCTIVFDYDEITSGIATTSNSLFFHYGTSGLNRLIGCFVDARNIPDDVYVYGMEGHKDGAAIAYKTTFRGFVNNDKSAGIHGVRNINNPELTAVDCIFEGNSYGIRANNTAVTITESYNCFYNNTYDIRKATTDITLDATDITTDPLFIAAEDAEIPTASPCVDAGIPIAGYVDTFIGSAPDMGCYETMHSIFSFNGTWNNGSDSGTYDLGSSVISIGRISEVLLGGGVSRPWCQQTEVILDDSDSSFLGTLAKGTDWYQGTFNIWGNDGTSWTQIMTGFVPAKAWSYDYSNKTARLGVTSMIQRAAAINMGFGDGRGSLSNFDASSNFSRPLGTVTATSEGTVTLTMYQGAQPVQPILNTYFWNTITGSEGSFDTSQTPGRLASFQGWSGNTGTWNLACQFAGGTTDWMKVGASVANTVPYPSANSLGAGYNEGYPGIEMFFWQAGTHLGLTWDGSSWDKFKADLTIVPLACDPMVGTVLYSTASPFGVLPANSIGTAPLYYGGGLWIDTMNDLMTSVGANWTVDGNGVIRAKIKRAAALEAVTGTVTFTDAEDVLDAAWTFTSTEGPTVAMVEQDWDNNDGRYTGTGISAGDVNTGDVLHESAKWQRGIGGALLAERLMKWERRIGRIFSLSYPVSYWGSFVPGSLVALSNIPGALDPDFTASGSVALLTAGKYVVQQRHYDYMEERIVVDLRQVPSLEDVFVLDYSELDGPDKLY